MTGNPCTEREYFKEYVYAFLPKLIYYAYRMVQPAEKEKACEKYRKSLEDIEKREVEERKIIEAQVAESKEVAVCSEAFMEYLNSDQLFKSMFAEDKDGRALLTMNEEAEEIYTQYYNEFQILIQQLYTFGLEQHKIRQEEIQQFKTCVNNANTESKKKSRLIVEDFIDKKTKIFTNVRKSVSNLEEEKEEELVGCFDKIQACSVQFHENCQKAWYELMHLELTLFEQLEEVNSDFERNLTKLVNSFIEGGQGLFVQCRNLERTFNEQLQELAYRYFTIISVRRDDPKLLIPPDLKHIMSDKEALNIALSTSHDVHLQMIDNREDRLIRKIKFWVNNMCDTIKKDEIKRNRAKVTEINHFLDIQREEFEELQLQLVDYNDE